MFRLASALPSFRGGVNAGDVHPKVLDSEDEQESGTIPTSSSTSTTQETTPIQSIPPFVRELNNSRVTRHSRASSIVSTQTRFTTTTLQEDARSIDINVGGQYFRISRDGSRVTADAPPPYTGPTEVIRFRAGGASDSASLNSRFTLDEEDEEAEGSDRDEPEDGATTPRSTMAPLDTDRGIRATILDPTEFEMPSPVGHDQLHHRSSTATLVQQGRGNGSDISLRHAPSFEQRRDTIDTVQRHNHSRRTVSQEVTPTRQQLISPTSPLRRANGVRLPRLITSSEIPRATHRPRRFRAVSSTGRPLQVRSAGAVLDDLPAEHEPRSPDYIGRNARATFPFPIRAATAQSVTALRGHVSAMGANSAGEHQEAQDEPHHPPAMDDENDISLHYARMMRTLDAAHRKALHVKDKQISELREKLNEKDIVLRQQLRAKDFIIDDLKKRLENLEENVEGMIERARNSVEDLWETRWKDRDFHLRERMRRIEEDAQRMIDRFRAGQLQSQADPGTAL